MLTNTQMELAVSANALNNDPNFDSGRDAAIELALSWYDPELYSDVEKQKMIDDGLSGYTQGQEVLNEYNLTFSGRNTHGGSDPANSESHIIVESGHIAASTAYRTARFYPKANNG